MVLSNASSEQCLKMKHSISILIEAMIKSGLATPDEIIGCSEEEIKEIESQRNLVLPASYKDFLRGMGKCAGWLLEGSDFYYPEMLDCQALAERLLAGDKTLFSLGQSCFVFIQHQGYQFMYFDTASNSFDPPVFHYLQGAEKPRQVAESFSKWLAATIAKEGELNARVKGSRPK